MVHDAAKLVYAADDAVAVDEYVELRMSAGMRSPPDSHEGGLARALERTTNVTARAQDGTLIGMVRVLDDGFQYGSIWDMAVHGELQRTGIGHRLMALAMEQCATFSLVALAATDAGYPLYERFDFTPESCGTRAMIARPVTRSVQLTPS